MRRPAGGGQRGQSLVEFGAALPVVLLLFLGAFDVSAYVVDSSRAQTAARQGARLASILGGQACVPSPLTQAQVDLAVAQNVQAVASTMSFSSPNTIYVYLPQASDGIFNPGTDKYTKFTVSGSAVTQVSNNLQLSDRNQFLPNESSLGVEMDWSYRPPTGLGAPNLSQKSWAVFKAMAEPTGC